MAEKTVIGRSLIQTILDFLQEGKTRIWVAAHLKVCVLALSFCLGNGAADEKLFLKSTSRLAASKKIPSWDLLTVLQDFLSSPFEV